MLVFHWLCTRFLMMALLFDCMDYQKQKRQAIAKHGKQTKNIEKFLFSTYALCTYIQIYVQTNPGKTNSINPLL